MMTAIPIEAKGRFVEMSQAFYKDYNAPTDRKTTAAMFIVYKNDIDKNYWPEFFNTIDKNMMVMLRNLSTRCSIIQSIHLKRNFKAL